MQPELTTVGRVQSYLRDKNPDSSNSALKGFVRVASRLIRSHTKRDFTAPREMGVLRRFPTYGFDTVHIDEVFSESDVLTVQDEFGMHLNYELDFNERHKPVKGADLTLINNFGARDGIQLPHDHADHFIRELRHGYSTPVPRMIWVRGNFGYEDPTDEMNGIPPDITFATTRACGIWYKEEAGHLTEDAFISRGQKFEPDVLPPIVMAMLRDWVVEDQVAI